MAHIQFLISLSLAVLCSTTFSTSLLDNHKLSPWLLKQSALRTREEKLPTVLVFLKDEADLSTIQEKSLRPERIRQVFKTLVTTSTRSQKNLIDWLSAQNISFRSYYINNSIAVDNLNISQLELIAKRSDVLKIVGNPSIRNKIPQSLRTFDSEIKGPGENIVKFGATRVWEELKVLGQSIVVGGQDTGVMWNHKALKNQYRGWNGTDADHSYSWHDSVKKNTGGNSSCGYNLSVPCDDHGHGTHTVGTIVGDDGKGNQIGVAPKAKWIACRNMDSGIGNPEMYIECFQWFLAPWPQKGDPIQDAKPEFAPHVINNSWGCPKSEGCEGGEFERILKALRAAGIVIVVSAGNDGDRCSTIQDGPAFHSDLVLSVGAINHRDNSIASFSSRGPSVYDKKTGPHVTAPGVNVRSAINNGGYAEFGWSGTSMAGPHIVGLVALLWSADPTLIGKIEETEALIKDKAEAKKSSQTCGGTPGSLSPNNTYGFGISNAYETIKSRLN